MRRLPPLQYIAVSERNVDFNLDFYTEVQDLSYLSNSLQQAAPRFAELNERICSLIEDYSLVGFETLAVEVGESLRAWCCIL